MELALVLAFAAAVVIQAWGHLKYRKLFGKQAPEVRARWDRLSASAQA